MGQGTRLRDPARQPQPARCLAHRPNSKILSIVKKRKRTVAPRTAAGPAARASTAPAKEPLVVLPGRPPRDSFVTKTEFVLPSDANALGTVFGGRVMEWIDIAAAISAQRHCRGTVVTASMDDLHFVAPIKVGMVVVLNAQVNYAGSTSVEVGVEVFSEDAHSGERLRCCHAFLTFVALGDDGLPRHVPPLHPETSEERRRYQEAEERRRFRLERRDRFR